MTSVSRIASAAPRGRVTDLLNVKVQENDPAMKVTATPFGFKVAGVASNNGIIASSFKLSFDGRDVQFPLSRGDNGRTVFKKLQKALPDGYVARVLENRARPPEVTIGIAQVAGGPAKLNAAKIPTSISANGASAGVESSLWVNLMPGAPRPNAIASLTVKGTGFGDRPPKFAVKSIAVYEKGTNRLVATIKDPKLVDSKTIWGEKSQTYRLEIPKKDLDLAKQYTFVVDAGINGAAPQKVRSEFVKVDKAY